MLVRVVAWGLEVLLWHQGPATHAVRAASPTCECEVRVNSMSQCWQCPFSVSRDPQLGVRCLTALVGDSTHPAHVLQP